MEQFSYKSRRWLRVRSAALRRDGYKCQWCVRYGRSVPAVTVHHIQHADEHPELAYKMDNLVSLCQACHNKAHPEKSRAARAANK